MWSPIFFFNSEKTYFFKKKKERKTWGGFGHTLGSMTMAEPPLMPKGG
jgi:hypothetical protein